MSANLNVWLTDSESLLQSRQQHILDIVLDPEGEWLVCACLDGALYLVPVLALMLVRVCVCVCVSLCVCQSGLHLGRGGGGGLETLYPPWGF